MAPRRSPRARVTAYNHCRPDGRNHLRQAMLRAALVASVALATLLGNPCFAQTTMREMIEAIRDDARRTADYTGVAELDSRVIDAMSRVERDKFVPWAAKIAAYVNRPLPIGHGQTISQPFIVALMTHLLQPRKGDRVLEIGTGSGYQAAVLAELVEAVYTIEIIPNWRNPPPNAWPISASTTSTSRQGMVGTAGRTWRPSTQSWSPPSAKTCPANSCVTEARRPHCPAARFGMGAVPRGGGQGGGRHNLPAGCAAGAVCAPDGGSLKPLRDRPIGIPGH